MRRSPTLGRSSLHVFSGRGPSEVSAIPVGPYPSSPFPCDQSYRERNRSGRSRYRHVLLVVFRYPERNPIYGFLRFRVLTDSRPGIESPGHRTNEGVTYLQPPPVRSFTRLRLTLERVESVPDTGDTKHYGDTFVEPKR